MVIQRQEDLPFHFFTNHFLFRSVSKGKLFDIAHQFAKSCDIDFS